MSTYARKPWLKFWPADVPQHLNYPNIALFELLRKSARSHPEKAAIAFLDQELTYKEIDTLADNFGASLAELGVQKGGRVALFLPNIPQFVIAYFGALKIGAIVTTISPLHKEREVQHQLFDSKAETIVLQDSQYITIDAVWQNTQLKRAIVTNLADLGSPASVSAWKVAEDQSKVHRFKDLIETDKRPPPVPLDPVLDLAALQYTGGTTGTAKAAMLTHRNLVANALAFAAWIESRTTDTFLVALPLFHIYGMTTSMNVAIASASKMVLLPRFEPVKALEMIQNHGVTVFCGVPTMYQMLLANQELDKYDLTSIRVCISGASPLPPQIQKKFMELSGGLLAEGYGLSEASPVTHCSPVDKTMRTVRVGSIGLPISDTHARIVDKETGTKTLPVGEIGELAVKGPQVMKGYWNKPEETASVLRDGWLLTGDIAYMDSEGYFYVTDRKKDLIKYRDFSVYPREIEDVLYEHPSIRLCAVVGKPEPSAGEIPKAYVVLKENAHATEEEIIEFVKARLASYKCIREVEFRQQLPLSSAGKVLKRVLREEEGRKAKLPV